MVWLGWWRRHLFCQCSFGKENDGQWQSERRGWCYCCFQLECQEFHLSGRRRRWGQWRRFQKIKKRHLPKKQRAITVDENGSVRPELPWQTVWYCTYELKPDLEDPRLHKLFRLRFRLPHVQLLELGERLEPHKIFARWHAGKVQPPTPIPLLLFTSLCYLGRGLNFHLRRCVRFVEWGDDLCVFPLLYWLWKCGPLCSLISATHLCWRSKSTYWRVCCGRIHRCHWKYRCNSYFDRARWLSDAPNSYWLQNDAHREDVKYHGQSLATDFGHNNWPSSLLEQQNIGLCRCIQAKSQERQHHGWHGVWFVWKGRWPCHC